MSISDVVYDMTEELAVSADYISKLTALNMQKDLMELEYQGKIALLRKSFEEQLDVKINTLVTTFTRLLELPKVPYELWAYEIEDLEAYIIRNYGYDVKCKPLTDGITIISDQARLFSKVKSFHSINRDKTLGPLQNIEMTYNNYKEHIIDFLQSEYCTYCIKPGHDSSICGEIPCRYCKKFGHSIPDCPHLFCKHCNKKGHSISKCKYIKR